VISEMISILRDFSWRRDSENHILSDDLIIKKYILFESHKI
jgi:hypothetical protein